MQKRIVQRLNGLVGFFRSQGKYALACVCPHHLAYAAKRGLDVYVALYLHCAEQVRGLEKRGVYYAAEFLNRGVSVNFFQYYQPKKELSAADYQKVRQLSPY